MQTQFSFDKNIALLFYILWWKEKWRVATN